MWSFFADLVQKVGTEQTIVAMNYGEMEMQTVQRLLDATSADW